ncbi:MAG: type II toxin-antitoxin system HipA family toxin [Undibacterium sp.]|nr:type II toxin-antitoxin system HipA family toxin [Undibacterium sp.]
MAKPFQPAKVIKVYIFDLFVGAVALDPKFGYYSFAFDPKFIKLSIDLAPLQMPIKTTSTPMIFTNLPEATYKRLPAMLADALPDDFGNAIVDRYMADQGISKDKITALDRLAYMGKRSMGALEFKPQHGPKKSTSTAIKLGELIHQARNVIDGSFHSENETSTTLRNIIEVGTSAGGARAKAVIAINPATDEIRSGQTTVPENFEHWLLKFDGIGKDSELGASSDYGRIEYAYSMMAKKAGIHMTECRLLEEGGRSHFMIKRFDRIHNTKIHMQTLCAMSHMDYKARGVHSYNQLFSTIESLHLPREDLVEAFRRMVFNAMAKNCDDHPKNFSFLLPKGGIWRLSPAYDVTFAHNPDGEWTYQHLMSINGKFTNFTDDDFYDVADRFGVGEIKLILKDVKTAIAQWESFAKTAGVSLSQVDFIRSFLMP